MEGFAQALARGASDREKILARPRKLLVPDDRTGLLSSPGKRQTQFLVSLHEPLVLCMQYWKRIDY